MSTRASTEVPSALSLPVAEPAAAPPKAREFAWGKWADRFGICLSGLCVIHCALTPVALLLLPALNVVSPDLAREMSHDHFHDFMFIAVPLLAALAFVPGYRRHRNLKVFAWALPGLALILLGGSLLEGRLWLESIVTIAGSAFLIRSHVVNRRLCACCGTGLKRDKRAVASAIVHGRLESLSPETKLKRPLSPRRRN